MKALLSRALALAVVSAWMSTGCVSTGEGDRPVSVKDAAHANVQLGVAYMQQGQLQLAKDKLDRAEKQDPGSFEVHWAMASLSERLALPEDAERHYQAAMRLAPASSDIANTYAVFLCNNGKTDRALPLFDGVIRDQLYRTPWAAATNAAVCLRADKRNGDAVTYLERALVLRRDYAPAVLEMAELQLALGKPALSLQTVDRYLALPRKSAELLLVGVRAGLAQGDRAVVDNYSRLLRRDFPSSPQTQILPQLLQGAN